MAAEALVGITKVEGTSAIYLVLLLNSYCSLNEGVQHYAQVNGACLKLQTVHVSPLIPSYDFPTTHAARNTKQHSLMPNLHMLQNASLPCHILNHPTKRQII